MSGNAGADLREQVRSRYAAAVRAVTFTTEAASGIHSAIIRAVKPAGS